MTVDTKYPYISASPDLEINCLCHGPGLVEIKCPASLIGHVPNVQNYHKHIEEVDGEIVLKQSSDYYYQIYTRSIGNMLERHIVICLYLLLKVI